MMEIARSSCRSGRLHVSMAGVSNELRYGENRNQIHHPPSESGLHPR
jgi:hypothetical protein